MKFRDYLNEKQVLDDNQVIKLLMKGLSKDVIFESTNERFLK